MDVADNWPLLAMDTDVAGRYRIVQPLGEGGMGTVYLAKQIGLDRLVAIKTIRPRSAGYHGLATRLRREAHAVQLLTHPNTVRIYDFGETTGALFLVMEYLEGRTLEEVLESDGPLAPERVVHIGRQVLKSLTEAHANGIIHRDIKPSNLMLCRQVGEDDFVKVLDFGLASLAVDTGSVATLTGESLGTPHYMSPEQVRGQSADCRSDLYSLGLTLFELATGQRAYDGASAYEIALKHVEGAPFDLPPELDGTRLGQVILRATRKERSERFASAEEMLAELSGERLTPRPGEGIAKGSFPPDTGAEATVVGALEERPAPIDAPSRRRRRWARGLLVLGGLVAVVALVARTGSSPEPTEPASRPAAGLERPVPAALEPVVEEAPPAPVRSRLAIDSRPSGAVVLLAGAELCRTPCRQELDSALGVQPVEVRLEGHLSYWATVDLAADVLLPVVLEPAAVVAEGSADEPVVAADEQRDAVDAERDGSEQASATAEPSRERERRRREPEDEGERQERTEPVEVPLAEPPSDDSPRHQAPRVPVNF